MTAEEQLPAELEKAKDAAERAESRIRALANMLDDRDAELESASFIVAGAKDVMAHNEYLRGESGLMRSRIAALTVELSRFTQPCSDCEGTGDAPGDVHGERCLRCCGLGKVGRLDESLRAELSRLKGAPARLPDGVNVMIDLETGGKTPDAEVWQVAAVAFNKDGVIEDQRFNGFVDEPNGELNASTLEWWNHPEQAEALEALLTSRDDFGLDLPQVLRDLSQWIFSLGEVSAVWAHPAAFDFPILSDAYRRCGLEKPWSWERERCARTVVKLAGVPRQANSCRHDALEDCRSQVARLLLALGYN